MDGFIAININNLCVARENNAKGKPCQEETLELCHPIYIGPKRGTGHCWGNEAGQTALASPRDC